MHASRFALALVAVVATALVTAPPAGADTIFAEDFESASGLADGNWQTTGQAYVTDDPLSSGNHVLAFSGVAQAGDLFSIPIGVSAGTTYYVSFDYLGLTSASSNSGGFIGYSDSGGGVVFFAGADTTYNDPNVTQLPSDDLWHHVELAITPATGSIRLALEDFMGPGGNNPYPNDAFFDNLVLSDSPPVPEPGTFGLLALTGIAAAAWRRHRSRRPA